MYQPVVKIFIFRQISLLLLYLFFSDGCGKPECNKRNTRNDAANKRSVVFSHWPRWRCHTTPHQVCYGCQWVFRSNKLSAAWLPSTTAWTVISGAYVINKLTRDHWCCCSRESFVPYSIHNQTGRTLLFAIVTKTDGTTLLPTSWTEVLDEQMTSFSFSASQSKLRHQVFKLVSCVPLVDNTHQSAVTPSCG